MAEATNTTWGHLSAHTSHTETPNLLEEVLGAKFKFDELSKQFGCCGGSKFGFDKKITYSNAPNFEFTTAHRLQNDHVETMNLAIATQSEGLFI